MMKIRILSRRAVAPLVVAVVVLLAPSAAGAGGGPPVPGGSFSGVTGSPGSKNTELRYVTTADKGATTVVAVKTEGGELHRFGTIDGTWQIPAVTWDGDGGGLSTDGRTLVLLHPDFRLRPKETRFVVLDTRTYRVRDRVTFDGLASFDAISPDGRLIYFVDYAGNNALDYSVRAYDVKDGELRPGEIVDPEEPDEQMSGQPYAREMSPDGRWAYTLYGGGEETFIHALDTEGATAVCVDLEQFTPREAYRLDLEVAASGAITVSKRGQDLASVDPETFRVTPVSASQAPVSAPDDNADVLPYALAIGAAAVAGLGMVAIRRRRKHREEAQLERIFAAAQSDESEPEREPEPVR